MAATRGGLERFVPALSWVPGYQLSWLSKDAIAGFTIWGLLIPEGIAYASLAGLPPQAGLYTLLASLVLYALFGTSKQLVVAGTSASAVLVYSAVSALHPSGAAAYGSLAAGLVILTGILIPVLWAAPAGVRHPVPVPAGDGGVRIRARDLRDRRPAAQARYPGCLAAWSCWPRASWSAGR